MEFTPFIESRRTLNRPCTCGRGHDIRLIYGMLHYAEDNHTVFCAALVEHQVERQVWVAFITGEWPGINHPDCFVCLNIWVSEGNRIAKIVDSKEAPFTAEDVFGSHSVSREQVLAVDGAKEWCINTYLDLFSTDQEIGGFIGGHQS